MRHLIHGLVLVACTVVPAVAQERVWDFKPGQTLTYEAYTSYIYEVTAPGDERASRRSRQEETCRLEGAVLKVDDEGTARVEFSVKSVKVKTLIENTGEHAEWDSEKNPRSGLAGFRRFEALLAHRFSATVYANGAVREGSGMAWPQAASGTSTGAPRSENAAASTHDPTPPWVWLDLIFACTPGAQDSEVRTLLLLDDEKLLFESDGAETIGDYACAKLRMRSTERKHLVAADRLQLEDGADFCEGGLALIRETRKTGNAWFSRRAGCLVKTELKAATEFAFENCSVHAEYRWRVELKNRSVPAVRPKSPKNGSDPKPGK